VFLLTATYSFLSFCNFLVFLFCVFFAFTFVLFDYCIVHYLLTYFTYLLTSASSKSNVVEDIVNNQCLVNRVTELDFRLKINRYMTKLFYVLCVIMLTATCEGEDTCAAICAGLLFMFLYVLSCKTAKLIKDFKN